MLCHALAEADHGASLQVSAAEDVITFKGVMGRSNSQAYFLTFCTFVGKVNEMRERIILLFSFEGSSLLTLIASSAR